MFEICSLDQYYWYSTLSEKKSNILALRNLLDISIRIQTFKQQI